MKILMTIIFFFAFCGTVFFFGRLMVWMTSKINPSSFKKEITGNQILSYNIIMTVSILLWTILYYLHL